MSYIGNPIVSTDFPKDTFSGNGSTTAFTMAIAPASVNSVIVVVSGITQDPSTYTISGTTLTFSAAPPTGTSNISVRHLGVAGTPQVPATGSVTSSSLASGNYFSQWTTSGSNIYYNTGNVGVGTSSPAQKFHIEQTSAGASVTQLVLQNADNSTGTGSALGFANHTSSGLLTGKVESAIDGGNAYSLRFYTYQGGLNERMRIDASGNVLISTTSNPTNATFVVGAGGSVANFKQSIGAGYNITTDSQNNGGTYYHMQFTEAGSQRGSITSNGGSTSYITGSDYRLKDNIEPMTGALEKVTQLKPSTWTWKSNSNDGQGFIAHELAEVVPDCVVGTKDQVDEEGNPVYQGIDTSFLVATLTAAIQEQQAMIEELKTRVTALETV